MLKNPGKATFPMNTEYQRMVVSVVSCQLSVVCGQLSVVSCPLLFPEFCRLISNMHSVWVLARQQ